MQDLLLVDQSAPRIEEVHEELELALEHLFEVAPAAIPIDAVQPPVVQSQLLTHRQHPGGTSVSATHNFKLARPAGLEPATTGLEG